MADTFRSDGKTVDVVLTAVVVKGDIVAPNKNTADGWHGIAMHSGKVGDTIAIEICREHEVPVGAVAAAKGAVLYLAAADGTVTVTATGNRPFIKVTKAKNAGNYVFGILLPQLV